MVDIIPGINETELVEISRKIELVTPHTDWVQVDMSDGTLVPTKTFMDIEKLKNIIDLHPTLSFEAHLMVAHPEKYVRVLAQAGFKRVTAHIECTDPRRFLEEAEYESVEVGLAVDGATEFEQLEPFLDGVDFVLVMTVEAGASGQTFMPETVDKIRMTHEHLPDLPIAVDGGINPETARVVRDAGATRLVSTAYIFSHPQGIADAIGALKS